MAEKALTVGIGEHAHQRGELRRASTMGDVEAAAGRARHARRGLLLILVHADQADVGVGARPVLMLLKQ